MENMLMLMLDNPGFIHELYAAHAEVVIGIFEGMRKLGIEFDGARLADDLGYRVAPLISPKLYRELVYPHHKRLCDHFAGYGLKTMLHSDGNIAPLIPHFLDAGYSALNPLEVKAGLDVRELAGTYGNRLVFYGNIDVRKLSGSREEIEQEITSKLAAVKETGGYIYHSDHSVPNSVSFENYAFAIELIKQHGTYGA
jgi:uroporphyrinogen decarboxylase